MLWQNDGIADLLKNYFDFCHEGVLVFCEEGEIQAYNSSAALLLSLSEQLDKKFPLNDFIESNSSMKLKSFMEACKNSV